MPIIDPSLGVVLPEKKPKRRCFWRNCPRDRASAATTKACARCKLVRYCSSSCQKADWKNHKEVCREPQNVDIGAWISVHEPELRWAAAQSLGGYSGSGPAAESPENPFVMLDVNVVPLEIILDEHSQSGQLYSIYDFKESARIRHNGGLGTAFVSFEIYGMQRGAGSLIFRQYKLGRPASASRGYVSNWKWVVKSLANDEFYDADLLHAINNSLLPADSTEDVLEEVD
ncbi:hypothetical protein EVG20_g2865 [Dentipellis fragilis]|uniref:MYND-type domain-containing protein n=1 Tax=Dentipellis fragilis TaxID=205917 RepID=A0A4Y9Z8K9_9AGAM|nr:hypothetical protein EVG20_g2865 [Dentipellis fragilis]